MVDGNEQAKLLDVYTNAVDEYRLAVAALTKLRHSEPSEFARAAKVSEIALKKAREARRTLQASRSEKSLATHC